MCWNSSSRAGVAVNTRKVITDVWVINTVDGYLIEFTTQGGRTRSLE